VGLARRDQDAFVAAPGLRPLLAPATKEGFLAGVRSTDLQSRQLIEDARRGALAPG